VDVLDLVVLVERLREDNDRVPDEQVRDVVGHLTGPLSAGAASLSAGAASLGAKTATLGVCGRRRWARAAYITERARTTPLGARGWRC
jgi:hypothetical protein